MGLKMELMAMNFASAIYSRSLLMVPARTVAPCSVLVKQCCCPELDLY